MKKAHGSRRENISCAGCGSNNVVKKGRSKAKFSANQIYKCRECGKRFVSGFGKSYPARIIMDSLTAYNLGNDLDKTSKIIKKKYKLNVPEKTIYSWVREFNEICSYYRIRKKALKLFKPKEIIFKKIFRHLQLYKYRYHRAKLEFFANGYFKGLKNYLADVSENCPDELFKDSSRSSRAKLNIDAGKIKVFKKENYACRLASLALESASTNYERHDKLQEFMISNDTCTIATEVPVYLYLDEIKEYGVLDLFNNLSIESRALNEKYNDENSMTKNTLKEKLNNENSIKNDYKNNQFRPFAVTGHIDFVQLKFGSVYVLDYKPEASKVDAVPQLFAYALALSARTGIWLRNFRCAWFDENVYYEFSPSDIVLGFCRVPKHKFREFFVRNKERRYFTGKEFQQNRNLRFKRDNNFREVSSHKVSGIMQSCFDMAFGKHGKIIFDDFILRYTSTKQLENLPKHDSSAIKCKCSATDFGVSNDVFADVDSHQKNNPNAVFKDFVYSIEEDEEELSNEIRLEFRDNSAFTADNKDQISALRMKLDVAGIAFDEFVQIFAEDVERHWNNKTVPTKFPWDVSWEEDLKDDIWHGYHRKFSDKESEEIKEKIGDVAYITGRKNFERDVKEKKLKVVEDGAAICDSEPIKGLVITWDSDKGKAYKEISDKYSGIIKIETEKEFTQRKHEAINRFKSHAELAEVVFYQYIRPYLLGILLSRATKGKAGGIVTSDRAVSFVSENKLVSKRLSHITDENLEEDSND